MFRGAFLVHSSVDELSVKGSFNPFGENSVRFFALSGFSNSRRERRTVPFPKVAKRSRAHTHVDMYIYIYITFQQCVCLVTLCPINDKFSYSYGFRLKVISNAKLLYFVIIFLFLSIYAILVKSLRDLFTRYSKEIEVQRVNVGRTRVSIGNFCSMRFLPYRPSSARVAVYITHRVYSSVYTSDSGRRVKRREKEALFGMRGERKYFQIRPFNLDGGVCARQTGALG